MAANKRSTRRTPRNITAEELLDYVRQQPDRAASFRHILEDFQADRTDRKQIKDILDHLVKKDKLIRHKGNRYEATPELVLIEGRMSLHRDGFGFVIPDIPPPEIAGDIFIAPPLTGSAMHGDRVGCPPRGADRALQQAHRGTRRGESSVHAPSASVRRSRAPS